MLSSPLNISANVLDIWSAVDFFLLLILSALVIAVLFGNSLVILAVVRYRRLQIFTNYLLVSLASADLLVGTVIMPPAIYYLLAGSWPFGDLACKLWTTLDVLLCTASILNLCVISLDRFVAISRPLLYMRYRSNRLAAGLISIAWVCSFFICIPPWLNVVPSWAFDKSLEHECTYVSNLSYRVYSALGSFLIPFCIMVFVYGKIFYTTMTHASSLENESTKVHKGRGQQTTATLLAMPMNMLMTGMPVNRKQTAHISAMRNQILLAASQVNGRDRDLDSSCSEDDPPEEEPRQAAPTTKNLAASLLLARTLPKHVVEESKVGSYYLNSRPVRILRERIAYVRERKPLKTVTIVVASFVLSWMPFFVYYLVESACKTCKVPAVVEALCVWCGYANSVLNPLIYVSYHRDFRRSFRDLLHGGFCRSKQRKRMSVRRLHQARPTL